MLSTLARAALSLGCFSIGIFVASLVPHPILASSQAPAFDKNDFVKRVREFGVFRPGVGQIDPSHIISLEIDGTSYQPGAHVMTVYANVIVSYQAGNQRFAVRSDCGQLNEGGWACPEPSAIADLALMKIK